MDQGQALNCFAALSQETRLQIVRQLVVAGPDGMAAGAIAAALDVSPSNLSFHLKELDRAGLISQARESRSIIYAANFEALGGLVTFLMEDCCGGHPDICRPGGAISGGCGPRPGRETP
ncbi:ArsR/SmtB family transcription factor [Rhizobium halophytocola]|uniref:DNA-binding transcriptional ArsR family regulator n=1 Tax=Rhizobium halophytocola TaxID=735519 RepID=A0ABS4DZR1_9HYPH|nr:metalloregulator ArsR/SmtB family transcription factor [Rhizobium halophytocola]MBP1851175.1 DNA-binding transcriptional ArsR family regulator [Rhizobium halophytocola]